MSLYTVENNEGRKVKFEWNATEPPTDADMEEVFAASTKQLASPPIEGGFSTADVTGDPMGTLALPGEVSPSKEALIGAQRNLLEGGGMIVGSILGSVGGPVGAVAGGGGGYVAGKSLADFLETVEGVRESQTLTETLTEIPKEFATGAAYEAGGRLVAPAAKMAAKGATYLPTKLMDKLALTKKGAIDKASKIFVRESKGTTLTQPQIEKNVKIAQELEKRIPGLKFGQGQLTNDASMVNLQRALGKHGGADLSQEQREMGNAILRKYYTKQVAGAGDSIAVAKRAEFLNKELQLATKTAQDAVELEVGRLSKHMDLQTQGRNIVSKLSKGKLLLKDEINKQFEEIPNIKINSQPLTSKIAEVEKEILAGEPAADIPAAAIQLINKHTSGGLISIKTMRGLNRSLNNMISKAYKGIEPNRVLGRRLELLKEGINESYDLTASQGGQDGVNVLRKANSLRVSLHDKFEKGTVADILQRGARGEETRIASANIAKEFYSLDGIDDFVKAIGDKTEVTSAMKDYVAYDFLNNVGEVTSKKAGRWLTKNAVKLKKLGIYNDFKNIETRQQIVESAVKTQDVFNKSVAGRIIESDLETMISNSFKGTKSYAKTARDLMGMVKGDKAAEQGLKKAFAENITKQTETTAIDFFQQGGENISEIAFNKSLAKLTSQIKKFKSALKIIYKDEPGKVKALNDVWKAYGILSRTAKSPFGGGSDTFELSNVIGNALKLTVGAARPGAFYPVTVVNSMVNKFGKANTEAYLRRMIFDPDYAKAILDTTKSATLKPEQISKINHLMSLIMLEQGRKPVDSEGL